MALGTPAATPAGRLTGVELKGGWTVERRLTRADDASGGHFSVGYAVARGKQKAFLKALDVNAALGRGGLTMLHVLSGGQWSEVELLRRCAEAGLSRVVHSLDHGIWQHPDDPAVTPVPYIITEWADGGDLSHVVAHPDADLLFGLDVVHGITCAVQQLHGTDIAHRDIRPSNGLLVNGRVKIGDLGHAVDLAADLRTAMTTPMLSYASPEVLYDSQRRSDAAFRAADLYLLGSLLISVVATRVPLTTLWVTLLDDEHYPENHGGPLSQVMPFVRHAYNAALDFAATKVPLVCDPEHVMRLVRWLTDPEPEHRGHPAQHREGANPFALDRIVSELDLIRRRTQIALRSP